MCLDFEKAFDRVGRDFPAACLDSLGFGPCLKRWVTLLHTNTQALVDVNGFHTRMFPIQSGVFQGSPLSHSSMLQPPSLWLLTPALKAAGER